jgi:hypothetical protein
MHGANNVQNPELISLVIRFLLKKIVIKLSYSSQFASLAPHGHLNEQLKI